MKRFKKKKKKIFARVKPKTAFADKIEQADIQESDIKKSSLLERVCLSVIKYSVFAALFTPLVINENFFFPFVCPKTIFFRILVNVMFSAYIILALFNREYRPKINALLIAISLFLIVLAAASALGVNLERSFWSTFERMTGLLTFFHLFAFYIVLTNVFKKKQDWEKILSVSVLAGAVLSLYILVLDAASTRGGGTIGNTSFMAAYLLFDIFFAFILALSKNGFFRIFAGVSLFMMLPVLFASTCRAGIAAFLGGILLLFLMYCFFSGRKSLRYLSVAIILSIVFFCVILFAAQPSFLTSNTETFLDMMNPRLVVWEMGLRGWLERPLLGWGPENFNIVFNNHFNPCLFLNECGGEVWFDRAHNIVFDTLAASGIIGLLSYLFVFAVSIYLLLKKAIYSERGKSVLVFLIMAVLLVVYFVQNLFVFDMISTYMMWFLSVAFISFIVRDSDFAGRARRAPEARTETNPFFGAIGIVAMLFVLWFGNIHPARSANYTVRMVAAQSPDQAVEFFEKAVSFTMEKYEPREHFCQQMSRLSADKFLDTDKTALLNGFELAEREMEDGIKRNPLDFRPHLFLGKLCNSSFYLTNNPLKLKKAETALSKAIELSPSNQQGYWYLAETRLAQDRPREAIDLLQKAIDLNTRVVDSHWYMAGALRMNGDYGRAMDKLKELDAADPDWKNDFSKLKEGIKVYEGLGNYKELIDLYKKALGFQNSNPEFIIGLFQSYKNTGDIQGANRVISVLESAPRITPDAQELIDKMKAEIRGLDNNFESSIIQ